MMSSVASDEVQMAGAKRLQAGPADDQRHPDQHQQPQLAHAPARPDAGGVNSAAGLVDTRFGAVDQSGVGHVGRARSMRMRMRPICSSSP